MQRFLTPQDAPLNLPFCSAVRVGDLLFLSGAIGALPGALKLVEGGTAGQAKQAMDNIGATLAHCGLSFDDVVKFTIMLADMSEWSAFNQVYLGYFKPGALPARSAFGCSGLALGARLEIECIARYP
jgi:reactive intermediate/imine deaminase